MYAVGSPHLPPPPLLDPAWYPDPTGRYEARYWDGRKWTSHISHYGATGADPLIRARWDYWWVRLLGRIVLWGAVVAVAVWAFTTYWPDSGDRDLEAEQDLMNDVALVATDLPADTAWAPSGQMAVSPLTLEVDDDGAVAQPACTFIEGRIADAADEPRANRAFEGGDGLRSIAEANTIAGGAGFVKGYLDDLRTVEAGECLVASWLAGANGPQLAVQSTQVMSEPSFGDEAVWWRLVGTDTSGAFALDVVIDLVSVRVDRVLIEFTFRGVVDPVGVDVQRDAISAVVGRADAGLIELEDDDDTTTDGESDDPASGGVSTESPDTGADG